MTGKSTRRLAALAALAACALTVGPLASQASAIPTKVHAHSILVDLTTAGGLRASVPLRPSAHLFRADTGQALQNRVVQFFAFGGFSLEQELCAERTDGTGYVQCDGTVRVTNPLLVLGNYIAVHPAAGDFGRSQDRGQLLTINRLGEGNYTGPPHG